MQPLLEKHDLIGIRVESLSEELQLTNLHEVAKDMAAEVSTGKFESFAGVLEMLFPCGGK